MNLRKIYGDAVADQVSALPLVEETNDDDEMVFYIRLETPEHDLADCCIIGAFNLVASAYNNQNILVPDHVYEMPTHASAKRQAEAILGFTLDANQRQEIDLAIDLWDEYHFDKDEIVKVIAQATASDNEAPVPHPS